MKLEDRNGLTFLFGFKVNVEMRMFKIKKYYD